MKLAAVLWDYDGTLMDSCHKNLSVNQDIFSFLKPEIEKSEWPVSIQSIAEYRKAVSETLNWLHFYMNHLRLTEFARNAEIALKEQGHHVRVLSIAAGYGGANPEAWDIQPNYLANNVKDILHFIDLN